MKKIIAISVMFVLIAGAAFADTSIGGNMRIGAHLASGKAEQDDTMGGAIELFDSNISANWSGDNAGGMMRFHANGQGKTPISWTPYYFGFVWWKPIEQFRLQIGQNADGDWGHAQISGWGYNAEAQNGAAVDQHRGIGPLSQVARTAAFWGGFGGGDKGQSGLSLSIFPAQGFEIDLGIPMAIGSLGGDAKEISATYLSSKINFKIDIAEVGTIRLAGDLDKANKDADLKANVFFAFYLSAIEGMGLEVGAAFTNEFKDIGIGLGLNYAITDDFSLKARLGFVMPDAGDKQFGIGLMPIYNLGSLKLLFNVGFGMDLYNTDAKDWFVNPYIQVPTSAGSFYAGIKIIDNGDEKISWAVPIQWNVYF